MNALIRRTSDMRTGDKPKEIGIKSLEDLIKIIKDEDCEIILNVTSDGVTEDGQLLIEIYDSWR